MKMGKVWVYLRDVIGDITGIGCPLDGGYPVPAYYDTNLIVCPLIIE